VKKWIIIVISGSYTIVTVIPISFYFLLSQVSAQENVTAAQIWRGSATSHVTLALQFRILFGGRDLLLRLRMPPGRGPQKRFWAVLLTCLLAILLLTCNTGKNTWSLTVSLH